MFEMNSERHACGLALGRLDIEVTEGVLIDDAARATAILTALQAQGIGVVLDDFGTGYSSLSYLRSFKFVKLKIDKSFVQGLGGGEKTVATVRVIIGPWVAKVQGVRFGPAHAPAA